MSSLSASQPRRVIVGAAVLLSVLAGCGSVGMHTEQAGSPSSAASAAADPHASEVNAAGDIPDNQVFVPYTAADGAFSVSVPEGWSRTADGAAVVFTDKFNSVRVEASARPQPLDAAAAQNTEVPQLRAAVPGFTLGGVSTVQRKAGSAVLITYGATSAPNPVTGKTVADAVERYVFWQGGQQVVLTLTGPKGADNVDPWRTVTDSFRWLRGALR